MHLLIMHFLTLYTAYIDNLMPVKAVLEPQGATDRESFNVGNQEWVGIITVWVCVGGVCVNMHHNHCWASKDIA